MANAGKSVPTDVDVMATLVGWRGACEGVSAGAALAGESPPAEPSVGFPKEAAPPIRNAEGGDGIPDGGDGAEPRDHRRRTRLVVQAEEGPQNGLKVAGGEGDREGCHGWEWREINKTKAQAKLEPKWQPENTSNGT